ncbi:response regulator transcription factor [Hyphomicrobium sulfonivorans]|uniref:response regulator transcription factor n=1 Tax=Hyphomicrobium sulfonivorans TaxID=121290 RepID=UPI000AF0254A|nr:response regulator transcription factor [Hyphomicrobium sulfonivorans]
MGSVCSLRRPSGSFQVPFLSVPSALEADIRILLVEDDDDIAGRLVTGLRPNGFVVDHAPNGEDGVVMGLGEHFDAAILDLGLPKMQGIAVLRKWRTEKCDMPVLILTAQGTWTEKVEGLNAGADDYITKPFHIPEVVARLRALIRRKSGASSVTLNHKGVSLDTAAGKVTASGDAIDLTASEFRLLTYFMHRPGRIVSQSELTERLYALDATAESNTIEVYISRLRRKLGRDFITTVRGLGYRMD